MSEDSNIAVGGSYTFVAACAIRALLPLIKEVWVGVEIGVWGGDSSHLLLKKCRYMYFIDPFCIYSEYPDSNIVSDGDQMEAGFIAKMNYTKKGAFTFLRQFSSDAVNSIPEVDFVFIDGNHTYKYVKDDILKYWPKVKTGGFLGGHDYIPGHPEVRMAVDDFVKDQNLVLHIMPDTEGGDCWYVEKQ